MVLVVNPRVPRSKVMIYSRSISEIPEIWEWITNGWKIFWKSSQRVRNPLNFQNANHKPIIPEIREQNRIERHTSRGCPFFGKFRNNFQFVTVNRKMRFQLQREIQSGIFCSKESTHCLQIWEVWEQ